MVFQKYILCCWLQYNYHCILWRFVLIWFIIKGSSFSARDLYWNWLYFSSSSFPPSPSSAKNSCSDSTVLSVFAKLGNLVEAYAKRWWCEARDCWTKGGAIALDWKCKLWTLVADEPYDRQRWHLYTLMRLLVPNNFRIQTFDLWCLDQLLFLIEFFFSFFSIFASSGWTVQ